MSADPVESPAALLDAMTAMEAGIANDLPAGVTQIVAGAQVSTIAQVQGELTGYIAVYQAAADAEVALKKAIKAREVLAATAVPRFEALRTALKGMMGKKNPDLVKVGLEPDKCEARNLELPASPLTALR